MEQEYYACGLIMLAVATIYLACPSGRMRLTDDALLFIGLMLLAARRYPLSEYVDSSSA